VKISTKDQQEMVLFQLKNKEKKLQELLNSWEINQILVISLKKTILLLIYLPIGKLLIPQVLN
jgi:hypothetical protein